VRTPEMPAARMPAEPARIGALGRIIGALVSPRAAFADIARRPGWVFPIVLLTAVCLVFNIVLATRVDWRQTARDLLERTRQIERIPLDQVDQQLQAMEMGFKIQGYARGVLGSITLALLVSVVSLLVFNVIGGGGVPFKSVFAISSYAILPLGLRELLAIFVAYLKEWGTVDALNPVASNVAAFLPSDAPMWQFSLGASVDLFALWMYLLLAIGFSAANPKKLPLGKALGLSFAMFLFFTALGTGIAFLTG